MRSRKSIQTAAFLASGVAVIGLVLSGSPAFGQDKLTASVPAVGCAADGQMGPIAAPKHARAVPKVPTSAGHRLAYYFSTNLGVLAPTGWHCFSLYGSGGVVLLVTPESHAPQNLFGFDTKLTGPAIELLHINGGTSGRFEVAKLSARLFPANGEYVRRVIDEGFEPEEQFIFGPYPDDTLTRRSDTEVEFVTAANREGVGTYDRMAVDQQPIYGVAILLPGEESDLVKLAVRLTPEEGDLSPDIGAAIERDHGTPTSTRHP